MASSNLRLNYGDYVIYLYGKDSKIREVTFQVTSSCNLCCTYCYECHKSAERMTLETGKKIVDYLISEWERDDEKSVINKSIKTLVFNFIGGEPFLEAELMDGICEYFLTQCAIKKCTLSRGFVISISTNGQNYFDEKVQRFLHKYRNFLSITVSVDGVKELHDKNRITASGEGSFDKAFAAMIDSKQYGGMLTKMTFVPDSFQYVYESIKMMLELGARSVSANYAYEPVYTAEHAGVLYEQLKRVADLMIDTKEDRMVSILSRFVGKPWNQMEDKNYCGGTGNMLSFAPDGKAYPCIRYAPISIGREKADKMCIGDAEIGMYTTERTKKLKEELDSITLTSQSTQECIECPVSSGCGWCSALNYETFGTPNKRLTNICWAHKGRSLACYYYFNKRYVELGDVAPIHIYLPKEEALKIISEQEWNEIKKIEGEAACKLKTETGLDLEKDLNYEAVLDNKRK